MHDDKRMKFSTASVAHSIAWTIHLPWLEKALMVNCVYMASLVYYASHQSYTALSIQAEVKLKPADRFANRCGCSQSTQSVDAFLLRI